MARALLVSYAGYPYTPSSLTPDNGLANLAGALLTGGHEVKIIDYGTVSLMRRLFPQQLSTELKSLAGELLGSSASPGRQARAALQQISAQLEQHQQEELQVIGAELIEEIRRFRPDFVGFKVWNGDGFTGTVALADQIRAEFPSLHIYAGGPQTSWFREAIYRRTDVFEAMSYGEGEKIILDLADHAVGRRNLADIAGLIYQEEGVVKRTARGEGLDLDELPAPVYDEAIYPAMVGDEKIKIIVLDDSRGCPFACGFCTHPVESGRRLRTASPKLLVDRMEEIERKYGVRVFRFSGSSTPGTLMRQVAEEIIQRDLDVLYTCFGHFASADPHHFELMARSGLYAIFFGIESGCQEVLNRAVGQKFKLSEVKQTVLAAQQAGIFTATSMIVPLPFDTAETLQQSLEFILEVNPDSVPLQFPGLLPGTPWFDEPEKFRFEADKEQVLEVGLDYKIKLLFPPAYWDPLPYKVNGMNFAEFTALTEQFGANLERQGILTGVPDDNALIARCAGMSAREFRDRARRWCLTGDAEAMGELVRQVNQQTSHPLEGI